MARGGSRTVGGSSSLGVQTLQTLGGRRIQMGAAVLFLFQDSKESNNQNPEAGSPSVDGKLQIAGRAAKKKSRRNPSLRHWVNMMKRRARRSGRRTARSGPADRRGAAQVRGCGPAGVLALGRGKRYLTMRNENATLARVGGNTCAQIVQNQLSNKIPGSMISVWNFQTNAAEGDIRRGDSLDDSQPR